jgi:prepilin-type N-terminal cleavage/methylation domain-containing protein
MMTSETRNSSIRGFTLVELLVVVAVVGVDAAIAAPGELRSRMSANEASAIGSMRTIVSAQMGFGALNRGFADDLASLAGVCPGSTDPFLGADLSVNDIAKSGYVFTTSPGLGAVAGPNDCFGVPTQTSYYASATPITIGSTGTRGFATNTAGALWQDVTGAVPTEPFTLAGTVAPVGR